MPTASPVKPVEGRSRRHHPPVLPPRQPWPPPVGNPTGIRPEHAHPSPTPPAESSQEEHCCRPVGRGPVPRPAYLTGRQVAAARPAQFSERMFGRSSHCAGKAVLLTPRRTGHKGLVVLVSAFWAERRKRCRRCSAGAPPRGWPGPEARAWAGPRAFSIKENRAVPPVPRRWARQCRAGDRSACIAQRRTVVFAAIRWRVRLEARSTPKPAGGWAAGRTGTWYGDGRIHLTGTERPTLSARGPQSRLNSRRDAAASNLAAQNRVIKL